MSGRIRHSLGGMRRFHHWHLLPDACHEARNSIDLRVTELASWVPSRPDAAGQPLGQGIGQKPEQLEEYREALREMDFEAAR